MNVATWLGIAGASLLGSAHCAAMCGSFVAAYSSGDASRGWRRALSHLAYNGGRLSTYLLLGVAAGVAGRALDLAGDAHGLASVAGLVTGALLVVWGANGLRPRAPLVKLRKASGRPSPISRLFASFLRRPALERAFLLGASSTLLPCGWLYAFVAVAATAGSAFGGALAMSAFWLGSLPVMLGLGWSLASVARRLHERLPRLRSTLILAAGVLTLLFRFQIPALSPVAPASAAPADVSLPKAKDCACHKARTPARPVDPEAS